MTSREFVVSVRRHPSDWQTAKYPFLSVTGLHWDSVSGGVGKSTSHAGLAGYVLCTEAIEGETAHSCSHGPAPHRIKVFLPKSLNAENWSDILAFAPPKPPSGRESVEALARGLARSGPKR